LRARWSLQTVFPYPTSQPQDDVNARPFDVSKPVPLNPF
jgi:hypothetical protein